MKKLDTQDRMLIQACLSKGMIISDIAERMGRSKSTISREIASHLEVRPGPAKGDCIYRKENFVCNICRLRGTCSHEKRYYDFEKADYEARKTRSKSRNRTSIKKYDLAKIDVALIEQVRGLKQGLHHVYVSNPWMKAICCERTIRRLIYKNAFTVRCHELRKYVVYKHEYEKKPNFQLRDISVLIGRQYQDFLAYRKQHKRMNFVEYDSVIGKITDKQCILTITFPKYGFQFGILTRKSDPKSVILHLKRLFEKVGKEGVKRIFPINLSDNGVEFSYFHKIENAADGELICRAFFTNPYKATDKPHCERYHEFIRYFLPKGKSLDDLTQEEVNWMFSQINSMVRKELGDRTPYDLVERAFGERFLNIIGIKRIAKKKVTLRQIR